MNRIYSLEPGFYQDLGELQKIKSNPDQRVALESASRQFEVTFLQTVLRHMRAATDALQDEEDKLIKGNELYQDMYDSQLAMNLSQHGGFGLADEMTKQLAPELKNSSVVVAPSQENLAAFRQPLRTHGNRSVD
jgi:flagellar protein FlgJ